MGSDPSGNAFAATDAWLNRDAAITVSLAGIWYRAGEAPGAVIGRTERALHRSRHDDRNRVTRENA
jgi:hypothetical protein